MRVNIGVFLDSLMNRTFDKQHVLEMEMCRNIIKHVFTATYDHASLLKLLYI